MNEEEKDPLNNGKKWGKDKKTGRFLPGHTYGQGRPKGTLGITQLLREALEEVPEGSDKTYKELLILKIIHKAIVDGDTRMIIEILDRIDGKSPITGSLEITGIPPRANDLISEKDIDELYEIAKANIIAVNQLPKRE
jgi:hypothetical protein